MGNELWWFPPNWICSALKYAVSVPITSFPTLNPVISVHVFSSTGEHDKLRYYPPECKSRNQVRSADIIFRITPLLVPWSDWSLIVPWHFCDSGVKVYDSEYIYWCEVMRCRFRHRFNPVIGQMPRLNIVCSPAKQRPTVQNMQKRCAE